MVGICCGEYESCGEGGAMPIYPIQHRPAVVRYRHFMFLRDIENYHNGGGVGGSFFNKVTRWRRAQRRKPKRG